MIRMAAIISYFVPLFRFLFNWKAFRTCYSNGPKLICTFAEPSCHSLNSDTHSPVGSKLLNMVVQ